MSRRCANSLLSVCRLAAIVVVFLLGGAAQAQTVRPVIAELGNPAKGRVEYVNNANVPLNVVLELKGFKVSDEGELTYLPLDQKIKVKLSATSFRIPPQQSYYVFYEAESPEAPTWFVLYAAFSGFGFRTQQGLNVRLELPHTVYLLPKDRVKQADVVVASAEFAAEAKEVVVTVENKGANFGRAMESWVIGRNREEGPGFPIFPNGRRIMRYPWPHAEPPAKVEIHFENFKVEAPVTARK